jgi:excisionase family DNA binding protein
MADPHTFGGRLCVRTVPDAPTFFTVTEVARMFGMSAVTVYRAINAGEFPAIRVRGRLFVPSRAVEEMVAAAIADRTVVDAAGWVPEKATR